MMTSVFSHNCDTSNSDVRDPILFSTLAPPQVSDPGRREGEEGAEGSGEAGQDGRQEQDRPTRSVENCGHFGSFDKDGEDEGPYLYLQLVVFVRSSIHVCAYVTETKRRTHACTPSCTLTCENTCLY